jgi:hypothetical protein
VRRARAGLLEKDDKWDPASVTEREEGYRFGEGGKVGRGLPSVAGRILPPGPFNLFLISFSLLF